MNEGLSGEGDCTLGTASERDGTGVVVPLSLVARKPRRPPPLTDQEIQRMRSMLEQWDQVTHACPIARRALIGT